MSTLTKKPAKPRKTAKRQKIALITKAVPGNPFAGVEHLFGSHSFPPGKAKRSNNISVPVSSPIIILDAGPLIAAINTRDPDYAWARSTMLGNPGPFIVTSAAVAEATH
ncbi:MAG: hypothetical protein H7Y06_08180 [Opitutaceae bacterium]|nr:hypothetical protein [Opitutaceae bacterium]